MIESLIDNGVPESKTLEYKRELPPFNDKGRDGFLADLSAFANSSGGHILYGIAEQQDTEANKGMPLRVEGLTGVNIDQAKSRIDNWIRDLIQPRITGHLEGVTNSTLQGWGRRCGA